MKNKFHPFALGLLAASLVFVSCQKQPIYEPLAPQAAESQTSIQYYSIDCQLLIDTHQSGNYQYDIVMKMGGGIATYENGRYVFQLLAIPGSIEAIKRNLHTGAIVEERSPVVVSYYKNDMENEQMIADYIGFPRLVGYYEYDLSLDGGYPYQKGTVQLDLPASYFTVPDDASIMPIR